MWVDTLAAKTGAMFKVKQKNQNGFTLIELLAVMAIVAVLAGIVAVAVGGTGETSKDTQTKQDATTVETAASDFFADQEGAEVLTPRSASVLDRGPFRQVKSSRWPEEYVSVAYAEVLPPTTSSTVFSVTFITESGTTSTITLGELLTKFNAVDFDALIDGNFMAVEPAGATQLTENRYNNYLWLLKKTSAAGGSSEGAARQVAVFKLVTIQKNEIDELVDLTYLQLVGEFTAASDLIADILVDEDATDKVISLGGFFTSVAIPANGNTNSDLVAVSLTGTDLTLDFLDDQNGTATITLLGTFTNGEAVEISFLVTVDAINDAPSFSSISDPAPVLDTDGIQFVEISGVAKGPASSDEDSQTVSLAASVFSETTTDVVTGLSVTGTTISYTPSNAGQAVIRVVANDGQSANNTFEQFITVTVGAASIVVPNLLEGSAGLSSNNFPFNLGSDGALYQLRYPSSEFAGVVPGGARITQIAFRPGAASGAFNATINNVEIRLGTMPSVVPELSQQILADNLNNAVLVHSGVLQLSSSGLFATGASGPKLFNIVIDVSQNPFLYDPATDDLVLEVRIPPGSAHSAVSFDEVGGTLSRIQNPNFDATSVTSGGSQGGLVTKFTFELVP